MEDTKRRSATWRCIEMEQGRRLEDLIRDGLEAGKTWGEVADALGCSRASLINWAQSLGIEVTTTRKVSFASEAEAVR